MVGGCLKRLGAGVETVQPTPFTDGPPTLMETSTFRCLYLGGAGGWVAVARDPHNVALRISSNCWDIVFIWNEDPTSEKSILHYCLSRRIWWEGSRQMCCYTFADNNFFGKCNFQNSYLINSIFQRRWSRRKCSQKHGRTLSSSLPWK